MQEVWLANPENNAFLLGITQQPKGRVGSTTGTIIIVVIMSLIGLIFGGVAVSELWVQSQLVRSGERISATVTNLTIDDSGDSTSYEVIYQYRVGDRDYRHQESVSEEFYRNLTTGRKLEINYLPANPATSRIAANVGKSDTWIFLIISIIFILIDIYFIYSAAQQADRNENLGKKGQLVYGELTLFDSHLDSDDDLMVRLGYRIPRPDGTFFEHRDRLRVSHNEWKDRLPKIGQAVAVLYLNDQTHLML